MRASFGVTFDLDPLVGGLFDIRKQPLAELKPRAGTAFRRLPL